MNGKKYRVLKAEWADNISPEKKAAIQSHNRNLDNPLDISGYVYLVQRGQPPKVTIAWEPAPCLEWF